MLISFEAAPYKTEEKRGRVGLFECECGCGQFFFAPVKTRYPRYANKTHRARAYRARARARTVAYDWWCSDAVYDGSKCYSDVYDISLHNEKYKNR